MLFPRSPRVVFERNPIIEVICQLRFPPILDIAVREPAVFQEKIRAAYPLYEREDTPILPKQIAEALPGVSLQPTQNTLHKFTTESGTRSIVLTRDFLAVSERDYVRWESLKAEIRAAKDALEQIYRPAFYSRLGLRYRNVIDRDALGLTSSTWDELLNSSFIGILGAPTLRDHMQHLECLAVVSLDSEVKDARAMIRYGLLPASGNRGISYGIDADLFAEQRYRLHDVFAVLDSFNDLDGRLFRWAIRDQLRDALGIRGDVAISS